MDNDEQQEMRYIMALGYAWGRKDATPYGSESGRKAMTTGSLDFATWCAATEDNGTNLGSMWEAFTALSPYEQRCLAESVKSLPYIERNHA